MSADLDPDTFEFSPLLDPLESENSSLIALYEWWLSQRRDGQRMPSWALVDTIDLAPWMGWLTVYALLPDYSDAEFRLVGTNFVEAAGVDRTGKMLSEGSYSFTPAIVLRNLQRIGQHAHACVQRNPISITPTGYAEPSERLWLPFSEDDQHVDRILLFYSKIRIVVPMYDPRRDR